MGISADAASETVTLFLQKDCRGNREWLMRTINLILPDALHERAQELAKNNRVSFNLLVATALAEKIMMLQTEGYLAERSQEKRASQDFHTSAEV